MAADSDFEDFVHNFRNEVNEASQDRESESFAEEQFTEKFLEELAAIPVIEDYNLCRLEVKGYKINAYNSNLNSQENNDKEGIFFDLFVTCFTNDYSEVTVTKTDINNTIRQNV